MSQKRHFFVFCFLLGSVTLAAIAVATRRSEPGSSETLRTLNVGAGGRDAGSNGESATLEEENGVLVETGPIETGRPSPTSRP